MISQDLAPELHSRSYLAHERLRPIYSVLFDKILIGFEEHARFPAEAVEALVRRAIDEGLSMVIQGTHLVPRYLSDRIISHPNILYITLKIDDEEIHRDRYLSEYEDTELEERKKYFPAIRKIHDYLVEQASNRGHIVVECTDIPNALFEIYVTFLKRIADMFPDDLVDFEYSRFDETVIHS
jgi:2-phosphoglycerate kinase